MNDKLPSKVDDISYNKENNYLFTVITHRPIQKSLFINLALPNNNNNVMMGNYR